jgi:hypothetical protein
MLQLPLSETARKWMLLSMSFLVSMGLFVCTTYIAPRPYDVTFLGEDLEHNYAYVGRLLHAGQPIPVGDTHHPGTPIYYLSRLVLSISGTELRSVQRFFDLSYFAVALVTAASLCAFVYMLPRDVPIGVSVLALASIVAWPPFLRYFSFFGSNSFLVAFGIPTIALFWSNLEKGRTPDRAKLFLSGLGVGVCLATKLSFVPVAVALLAASSLQVVLSARYNRSTWWSLLCMPVGLALSFFLLVLPIFGRLLGIVIEIILRGDTGIQAAGKNLLGGFVQRFNVLLKEALPFSLLLIAVTVASLYLFARYVQLRVMASGSAATSGIVQPEVRFDYLSGGVFLVLMMLGFVFTTSATEADVVEKAFRNVTPTALFVPFLILYCCRLSRATGISRAMEKVVPQALMVVAAVGLATSALVIHLDRRDEYIKARKARIAGTMARLEMLAQPGTRIAIYDDEDRSLVGEASFHFWGNFNYANGLFDQVLLDGFPKYAYFRLREIDRIVRERYGDHRVASGGSGSEHGRPIRSSKLYALGRAIYRFWHKTFPLPSVSRSNEIVAGERYGVQVSIIAFVEEEGAAKLETTNMSELLQLIQERFGPPRVWKESIEGIDWVIIAVPGLPHRSNDEHVYAPS